MNISLSLDAVKKYLWEHWDPIGVNAEPRAFGEYDGYAPGILSMLSSGMSARNIANYLTEIVTVQMGMGIGSGGPDEHSMKTALGLIEMWEKSQASGKLMSENINIPIANLWLALDQVRHSPRPGESILERLRQNPWEHNDQAVVAAWEVLTRPENLLALEEWAAQKSMNLTARQAVNEALRATRGRSKPNN